MLKTCLFVSYTCSLFRDGYMLKGNNTTQCFFGNWTGMTPWCKEGNFFWITQSKRWGGRHIMPLLLLFRKCWKTKQVRKRTAAKECAVANPFSCLICGSKTGAAFLWQLPSKTENSRIVNIEINNWSRSFVNQQIIFFSWYPAQWSWGWRDRTGRCSRAGNSCIGYP